MWTGGGCSPFLTLNVGQRGASRRHSLDRSPATLASTRQKVVESPGAFRSRVVLTPGSALPDIGIGRVKLRDGMPLDPRLGLHCRARDRFGWDAARTVSLSYEQLIFHSFAQSIGSRPVASTFAPHCPVTGRSGRALARRRTT